MLKNFLIIAALSLLTYALTLYMDARPPKISIQPDAPVESMQTDRPVPSFAFTTADGREHPLEAFRGKIILLNFWASWCAPCVKEFPSLLRAAQDFPDTLVLIALSSDLDEPSMKNFTDKLNGVQNMPNVFIALDRDQAVTQTLFQTFKLPETWLIGPDMTARAKIVGGDWAYETLKEQVQLLQRATENDT